MEDKVVEDVLENYICWVYEEHMNNNAVKNETLSYFDDVCHAIRSSDIKINHAWLKRNIQIIEDKVAVYNPVLKNDIEALEGFKCLLMIIDNSGAKKIMDDLIKTVREN